MSGKYNIVIDADFIVYKIAHAHEDSGSAAWVKAATLDYLKLLTEQVKYTLKEINKVTVVISCSSSDNFRLKVATIKPYKANRVAARPKHYQLVREVLQSLPNAVVSVNEEADDVCADLMYKDYEHSVLVAVDKDLRQVPGWHFEPGDKRPIYFVDPKVMGVLQLEKQTGDKTSLFCTGEMFHYAQMLLGDVADNIPGIKGWGAVKIYKNFKDMRTIEEVRDFTLKVYKDTYKDKYLEAFKEVYTLLQMGKHSKLSN